MSYTKTNWQNDTAPAINATNLNHIEQGIFNNDAMLSTILTTLGINTTTWVSSDSYVEGQSVVYNNKIYKNITGNYTTTPPDEDTTNWQETTMLDIQYPVGKTEIFYDDLDHSNYLGFTWEKYAAGRCLVGKDSTQTEFDTIGKTGGEKKHTLTIEEMPSHNHLSNSAVSFSPSSFGDGYLAPSNSYQLNNNYLTGNTGGGQAHNILQPYIVVNIWKRVS